MENEIIVTRQAGQAPVQDLLAAQDSVGYPGSVIPVARTRLRIRDMNRDGAPRQVQQALSRVVGVRMVRIDGAAQVTVTGDERRLKPRDLVLAARRAGFKAEITR